MNTKNNWHNAMQTIKRSLFSCFGLVVVIRSWRQNARRRRDMIPSNIYSHCNELPLSIFIDCSVDKSYHTLIKSGKAAHKDLLRAWEQIYSEYAEKSGSESYKLLMNISKDLSYMQNKHMIVAICLKVLQHRPEQRCIDTLRRYGYKYAFDISNQQQYAEDISAVATRTGAIQLQIERQRRQLTDQTKKLSGKDVTRDDFGKILAALSKHMNYRIDPKITTVSEFIYIRQGFEREIEALQKATHGK